MATKVESPAPQSAMANVITSDADTAGRSHARAGPALAPSAEAPLPPGDGRESTWTTPGSRAGAPCRSARPPLLHDAPRTAQDGERGRVQEVGELGAGERGAHHDAAPAVDHEAARARRVAAVERAARIAGGFDVDNLHVDAGLARTLGRVADGSHLRVAE